MFDLPASCRRWTRVAGLILDESQVLLDIVQPGQVRMSQHMGMEFPDARFLADRLYLSIVALHIAWRNLKK